MTSILLHPDRHRKIRALFDEYIERYAARDDRLTTLFSENFSGYTGGGNELVTDRDEWVRITRQDFAEVPGRIRIEMRDIALQDLSEEVVVVTAFFNIHLPLPEHVLSREVARLVLIFRLEGEDWKIVHSGISIPYQLVQEGEVYPLPRLQERNQVLEALVEERTRELNEREAFYRLLTEDTLDVIWRTDSNFLITYISPSDERLRGFKAEEVVGRHALDLFADEGIAVVTEAMRKRQQAGQDGGDQGFISFEAPHRCKDGRTIWGEVFSTAVRDEHGTITGYHGITREITKRKQMQDQVKELAFYDTLTRLPNRRLLNDRLCQTLAASKRSGRHGALMFVDLDNFKPLNDKYGHFVGDLLLLEVANRLKGCVREMDTVARFGGDEFVVMLGELDVDHAASIALAEVVAEKIRTRLSGAYCLKVEHEDRAASNVEHHCSASIGVVVFLDHEASPDDILICADKAMYQAKAAGRNAVRFYVADDGE
ncbi:diguanylate cyclase domain-containing protein [Quatrionicoccus australiensis]|uniref:diguanylate cyclase domain-containing protein n=1 Tax=Quatrionicoccus australiensis TaxID=138118 RepID=UPI001CFBB828|nr:diguanylate cyclase [Quatrionicoccus australiensis]MCB4361609.1 diguanylate cyclase [Quatrionicoccus australiensis]